MLHWIESAPVRPAGRTLATVVAAAVSLAFAGMAMAQNPTPPAKPPAHPAAKPAAKPAAPAKPAEPAQAQPAPQPGAQAMPQFIYSPWTKVCPKASDPNVKQVCFTGIEGRLENGMPVVTAAVVQEADQLKLLRVTVPLGTQLAVGTRIIIDQGQPMGAPYVFCFTNGCASDYQITPDTIAQMKKGQTLTIQAINISSAALNLPLPLNAFAKAFDGPAMDPKVIEEQQQKLQEELQRRADEARKKLDQQGQPGASAAPAK